MSHSKTIKPLSSLSELCSRLSRLIKTEPIEQMSTQLQQQQRQNERNCRWLDEAFDLLDEVTKVSEPDKAPQIIAKIESFISKAEREDYHEGSQSHFADMARGAPVFGEHEYDPGSEQWVNGEIPKKN